MCMINMLIDNFGIKHLFTGVFLDLEILCIMLKIKPYIMYTFLNKIAV